VVQKVLKERLQYSTRYSKLAYSVLQEPWMDKYNQGLTSYFIYIKEGQRKRRNRIKNTCTWKVILCKSGTVVATTSLLYTVLLGTAGARSLLYGTTIHHRQEGIKRTVAEATYLSHTTRERGKINIKVIIIKSLRSVVEALL